MPLMTTARSLFALASSLAAPGEVVELRDHHRSHADIVEFSNQLREKGEALVDAVIDAATLRLRPILMTTGAMVLGAVPLAWAHGAGAESRQQIGYVIVGGMLLGTLLTLFVVPTAYTLLARKHKTFEDRLAEERIHAAAD